MTQEPDIQPEVENWKDKYLRLLADQENTRKRLMKEKQEMVSYGIESAVSDFIPPIDQLEKALEFAKQASGEVKNWAMGFEMILSQFKAVLQGFGVTPIETAGCTFDPHLHEAVEIIESLEHPEGTILQEFARGYRKEARTLRPARVKVTRQPETINEEVQGENYVTE